MSEINPKWQRDTLPIGGEWITPSSSERITVISPSTGQPVGSVPDSSPDDVHRAVAAAKAAFHSDAWSSLDGAGRADLLDRFAEEMMKREDDLVEAVTIASGIPSSSTRYETLPLLLAALAKFAQMARDEVVEQDRESALPLPVSARVRRVPLGVVAIIIPWNIPLLGAVTKLSEAWAAGCTTVFKPAPETPFDALIVAEIAEAAGFPAGVLNVVTGGVTSSQALVDNPDVNAVNFTGSTATGRLIAQASAKHLRPCILELGGNAASLVLDDAPMDEVVPGLVRMALALNNGEACIAQTRVLVTEKRKEELVAGLAAAVTGIGVGDPFEPTTMVGPLISEKHRARVEDLIASATAEGARLVAGGSRPEGLGEGYYLEPTVFADVTNDMRIAREEIFGPVVTLITVADEDEAIRIANDTEYGLSHSVWSSDTEHGMEVARKLNAGSVWLNGSMVLDPNVPFGGWKASGYGRDGGLEGFHSYQQTQALFQLADMS